MNSPAPVRPANTWETLAAVLRDLRTQGLPCDLFGGWAEELLGLREPWAHRDIDLVYRGESLAAFDSVGDDFSPVPLKRFHHKRAFIVRDVLCEITLVENAETRPVTHYWGDVPFHWEQPVLDLRAIDLCGQPATIISGENLRRHRRLHGETRPDRWRDPGSLVP